MEFWGAEVKPGKPYTLSPRILSQRTLHLSTATVATVPPTLSNYAVMIECNIGDKTPLFLGGIVSRASRSFFLNAEFNEEEGVKFSVFGSYCVYLLGYYLCPRRLGYVSEPSGEDIGTESDEDNSVDNDDSYEKDSFIDDDEPLVFVSEEKEGVNTNSRKRNKKISDLNEGTSNGSDISCGKETDDSAAKTVVEESPVGLKGKSLTGKAEGKEVVAGNKVRRMSGETPEDPKKIVLARRPLLEKGIDGMKAGERRIITLPPSLGFGEDEDGHPLPHNSQLVYQFEVHRVI